jgi:hypothetical protein
MTVSDTSAVHISSLSLRWQRAAMLGSLWAANEIVLGSFLHNLSIPFSGTFLAAIGVTLLVAGHRLWNDPGVLWRAGVICSLMKSISPSAVILGPMAGILAEAGLVYVGVLVFRGLFIGALLGGNAGHCHPILQKIISILVTQDGCRTDVHNLFTVFRQDAVPVSGRGRGVVHPGGAQAIPEPCRSAGHRTNRGANRAALCLEMASANGDANSFFTAGSQHFSLAASVRTPC